MRSAYRGTVRRICHRRGDQEFPDGNYLTSERFLGGAGGASTSPTRIVTLSEALSGGVPVSVTVKKTL